MAQVYHDRQLEKQVPPLGLKGGLGRDDNVRWIAGRNTIWSISSSSAMNLRGLYPTDTIEGLQFAVEGNLMATTEQTPASVSTAAKTRVFKNFINGEWVESRTDRTFENLNPADTREVVGIFQRSGKEDVDQAIEAARQAFKKWRLVPAPRRAEILYKASELLIQRKEAVRARHDPRDGQGHQGDARRRAGGHRLRLLHRRRRPPHVRADRPVGAAQQVRHGDPPAAGRLRHDHAVEFPHGDSVVEAFPCAGRRQHRRHQARAGHAALDLQLRADAARRRRSRGRGQHRHRLRRRSRHADGRASRGARRLLDRLDGRRPRRWPGSREDASSIARWSLAARTR